MYFKNMHFEFIYTNVLLYDIGKYFFQNPYSLSLSIISEKFHELDLSDELDCKVPYTCL